ncbi:MAG: IgGFc-binding protein [Paludibacteraceae bacterium]|nr:IgGFc-binding protein [Paludibacteraceae bacterium]
MLTVIPVALLIGFGVVATLVPERAYAASSSVPEYIPSTGRDFWLTYMSSDGSGTLDLQIMVIPKSDGSVKLKTVDGTGTETVRLTQAVSANVPFYYSIPAAWRNTVYTTASDVISHSGLHITSEDTDFALYMRNRTYLSEQANSYDMSAVFPTQTLGTDYVVQTYWLDQSYTEFAVIATEDNTTINITPRCQTLKSDEVNWYAAGTTITKTLAKKGDVYLLKGPSADDDAPFWNLSGTTIGASKPVAVFQGGMLAFIPEGSGLSGDHIFEQSLPIYTWGKRFVAMNMSAFPDGSIDRGSKPTEYLITAVYPDTKIYVNGTLFKTLNAGESNYLSDDETGDPDLTVAWEETPKVIETSQPVSLVGFMVNSQHNPYRLGGGANKYVGEPSMAAIPDVSKGVKEVYYYCKDNAVIPLNTHYANIIVRKEGVAGMRLNDDDISAQFTLLTQTFSGSDVQYAYARVSLTNNALNKLSNVGDVPFVAIAYSVLPLKAMSEAGVMAINLVPSAPIVKIDGNEVTHNMTLDYCNRHPGINFSAVVDYPHTSVKWDLGEGAVSTSYNASHMYGATVGESDATHNIRFYVYHESPITHVKDTDSVRVTLNVHPVYYDTLKTKVAAKHLAYTWDSTSYVPFGLFDGVGNPKYARFKLGAGKDSLNRQPHLSFNWANANVSKTIFDSLKYATRHDCDSMFYLQLQVVPDILMPAEDRTVCQEDVLAWAGHAADAGHRMSRKNLTTNKMIFNANGTGWDMFKTDEYGTFEIRDTLVSKVFPFPDSIHVMNLTINVKPTITINAVRDTCDEESNTKVRFTTADATSYNYYIVGKTSLLATPVAVTDGSHTIDIPISTIEVGNTAQVFTLKMVANTATCVSDTVQAAFIVNPTPTLTSLTLDAASKCYPAESFTISYNHTNAKYVHYKVTKGGSLIKDWTPTDVTAEKKFTIATNTPSDWEYGTYTVEAYAESDKGCESTHSTIDFVISKQPTISAVSIVNQCDEETTTTLTFTTADAANYNYYIVGKTSLPATPVATTDGAKTINVDISMLTADTYTLKLVANSAAPAGCPSDTTDVALTIYPMPIVSVTALESECYPAAADKVVTFGGSTTADSIKWVLKRGSTIVRQQMDKYVKRASVTLTKASDLGAAGLYTFTVTAIKTTHDCEVLNPTGGEIQFTLYDQAHIELSGTIADQCEGDAIEVTVKDTYADTLMYEVKQGGTLILKGGKGIKGGSGTERTSVLSIPTGAGKVPCSATGYTVTITADNSKNCGGNSVTSSTFYVHKIPSISAASLSDASLCETVDKTELSVTTDAGQLIYEVKKGSATWVAATPVATPASGKLTLLTDTLSAGSYTITLTPKSTTTPSCVGTPFTPLAFVVHPKPVVNTFADAAACFGDAEAVAAFTATNGSTYNFQLKDKNGLTVTVTPTITAGSVTIPLSATMTAALSPYTMRLQAVSEYTCLSDWKEATLTIHVKPSAGITSVESKCDNETSAAVVYTSSNATKYEYRVFKAGVLVQTVTNQDVSGTTFNLDISGMDAGSYELRLVAKSATCASDTAKKAFDIWPLPVVNTLDNTTPCEGETKVLVPFTATNVQTFSYTVKDGATVVKTVSPATVADGKIEVDIDGLTTGGAVTKAYTLSVTAVSEHSCATAAAKEATITLKAKPAVTLSSVTNTCAGAGAAITVAYTGLTATNLDYVVRKAGVDTPVSGSKTGLTPGDGSFTISGAALEALAAGTDYEVELIAQGDNGCPSVGVEQLKAFTIYPLPTVAVKPGSEEITVCEGREDAVFEFTTSANASTYSYETGALGLTATDQAVVDQKIKITLPKADLKDGNYTLTVTVKSAAPQSCSSVAATATLHVNNRPWLKINDIAAECHPVDAFTVGYTSSDAKYVRWTVDGKITSEQTHTVPGAAPYQFTINTNGWAAGTYTLRARPVSALDCDSAAVVKTFTIHPKPATITDIVIAKEPCAEDATMNVTFKKDALGNCALAEIVETGLQTLVGTPVEETSRMIPVSITGLTAGTYTLRIYTYNNVTNCKSTPVDKSFTVYPRPTLTAFDTTAIHPVASVDVRYAATDAAGSTYTYTLTGAGIPAVNPGTGSGSSGNSGIIPVNTEGLNPGVYDLSLTVTSEHGCDRTAVSKITIFNSTSVTIAHIDSVCKGENIADVKITTTYANKYSYVVKNSNGDPVTSGTGTTTNNEGTPVDKEFSIATNTWDAGTYALIVTAENTVTTAMCNDTTTFTINPTPVLTFTAHAAICEAEVNSVDIAHSTTNIKKLKYHVDKVLPLPVVANIVAETEISSTGTITLTTTGWADGTYRIYATPTSEHGCVGVEASTDLVVNNHPEITLTAPANPCAKDSFLFVDYTASADAHTYAYKIYNVTGGANELKFQSADLDAATAGTMKISIVTLPAGNYRLDATVRTEAGCTSDVKSATFEIYVKPSATLTSMQSVCEGTATATAAFTTEDANTYTYQVKGTTITGNGTTTGSGTFGVNVSTLTAAGSPYTLQFVSKSDHCKSDTATISFAIRPIPVVAITTIDDVCLGDATTTVTYNPDANVTSCTYTLKQGATVLLADQAVTLNPAHTFTINTSELPVETYTVELTPSSQYNCAGAMVSSTFKVNKLPTMNDILLDANAVCEGTATMRARFYHTGADSCHWELCQQGTTTVVRSGDKTGLSDGTTMIDIDLLAPTVLEVGKSYDLKVTSINKATTCEISQSASFLIRKNPVFTYGTTADNQHHCQPVTEVKLNYTNENNRATFFRYEVLRGTTQIIPLTNKLDVDASGEWTISFGTQLLQGEYKLHVTPANDYCPGEEKILTFHVDTVMPVVTDAAICYGESYDWSVAEDCNGDPITLMRGLTTSTHQLDTLFCDNGCNKVYKLNLTVYPEYAGAEEQHTLCANDVLTWRGQTITEAGTYESRKAGVAPNGCDSVYRIVVKKIVPEQKSSDLTVCYGEPVIFNGTTYNNRPVGQQVLLDTIKSLSGCDSVYLRLNLTVGQRYYDSIVVAECKKYVWPVNGYTYTHSGVYREELSSVDGCDSVCVLNLTINDTYEFFETYDIATRQLPYTVHEYTYTSAGTYDRTFTTVAGCDSIYHITLNVHPTVLPKDTFTKTICDNAAPYNWRGTDYSNSGWYSKTTTVDEKDTVHVLHLTVNKTYSDTTYVHSCGAYTWYDMNCTATGNYTHVSTSSCGCDSVEVLNLTVGASTARTVNVTACQYELTTVGNRSFVAMSNTSFTETLTNASGCDSVVTYNVTVTPRTYSAPDDMFSFCEGTTFSWHGHTYDKPGTYYDTVPDGNCCSVTINTLQLSQNSAYHFEEDVEVSELALPYAWRGHKGDTLLRTNGDYYDRWLSQVGGCDSVYHIHFHVNFVTRNYDAALQGCESVTWSRNGKTYTESCLASDTVFTDAPANTQYNTIYFCDITVNHGFAEVEPDFTVCRNEAFTWHGQNYAANYFTAGDHTLTYSSHTIHGCDSSYTATVHVIESFRNEASYAACPNELPYNWHGQLLTVSGTYTDAHTSVSGCDSVYVLNFSVKTVTGPDETADTQCEGAHIQWCGLDFTADEAGEFTYYQWYKPNAADCPDYETYHKLNLTVGKVYDIDSTLTKHICQSETFDWFGATRSVPQDGAHQVGDHMYVETFHKEVTTKLGCDSLHADLTLVMHLPYEKTLTDTTVCNSYDWDGLNITTSGDYTRTYHIENLMCADSVLHRKFTVLYSEVENTVKDECNSYYWPRTQQVYTESGHYEHNVPQLGGLCDKIYTLDLTIRKTQRDTAKVLDWCHEFTWAANGKTYHTSAFDSVVYAGGAGNGCDSVAYLYLTLDTDTVFYLPAVTACDTYTWAANGMTYTGSTLARYQTTKQTGRGCDSIVYLPITILHPAQVTHNLEGCRQLIWNNVTYTTSQVAVQNFECDSVVTLNITINHPDTVNHVLRGCESVTWNGQTYTYTQKAQQDFLCDSVVMLDISIDHAQTGDDYVTRWDSYDWEGDTYTASGNYTKTLPSMCGCDSVVTLHLTINDSQSDEETQLACESYDWAWSGLTYTTSGDYVVTNTIDAGLLTQRDSTRTLHLGIGHKKFRAETVTDVCDAYVWHGTEYLTGGTYTYEYSDTCDGNVDTLHLTLYHKSVPVEYYDTACDVMTINGRSYFSSTEFTETLQTDHGCDSVVNYHLTINHRQTKSISVEGCGSYTWEGTTYTQSGIYTKVLTGANGCDSVVTLTLSLFPSTSSEFSVTSCENRYIWGNMIIIASGDYTKTLPSIKGCDSIVTLHLSLPETIYGEPLIVQACDEYWWNGQRYTETGSYTETLTSLVTGCDSVARLNLNIEEHPTGEFTETAQEMFTWGGETYYESGDYEQRFPTATCDSIVTLHLTITSPKPINEVSATACDAYTWDSETFYESGVYTRNFPTLEGNDSIVKLTLTITQDTATSITAEACDTYVWNSVTYDESGVYTQTLQRASGCDSVVTLTLTIRESFATSFTATARDVYTWDSETFTASGSYTHSYQTVSGCDSTATLILTIIGNEQSSFNAEACTDYAWADSIFTRSTIHSHVFPASNGCDSVVTMTLVINEPVYTDLYDTVSDCSNPLYAYTLPWGEQVQHSGIYSDTLQSALTQCDSIVRLHLQWCAEPLCIDTVAFSISDCESYVWEGQTYTATGTYYRHYRLENGCDSVSQLRLTIKPKSHLLIEQTACDSLYWENTDTWYYASGFYYDTVPAANGCDSVNILHAVIGTAAEETIERTSCDALTLNGETFTESGTFVQHLTTVTGCDSTLTINLTISPSVDTVVADTACDNYLWHGQSLTETGFYPQVLSSAVSNCDSVVNLHLIVYGSKAVDIIDSLHCDSIVWGDDVSGIDTIYDDGIYTKVFQTSVGCDSTVTMDLRLLRHDIVTADDTAACDSLVWNGDFFIYESGTYTDTLVSALTGCDSIITMNVTINPTLHVEIEDSVPPPFYLWPSENDTIWESGVYVDTTASLVTGCDSITTLTLVMTDSIILDPQEPVRIDTFGYCPGDTMNLLYNLLKGHPTKYRLVFDTVAVAIPDYSRQFKSVLDTVELPNHGMDSLFTIVIPEYCPAGTYCAELQLFDDFSSSEIYNFCITVNIKGYLVSMWTDVVAINNFEEKYIGYKWYKDDVEIPGAEKQYYSDGEDLNGCYRAKVQLAADSSWVFTCEECFDLRTDSLELIAYPTPAPVGQPVTIKAMGILLEKLIGSRLTITNVQGLTVHTVESMTRREEEVNLPAGLYIATLVTGDNDDRTRTATVKFTVF